MMLESWQFDRISEAGFGDSLNAYPHTMAWYKGRVFVGTMRANLCLLKAKTPLSLSQWPVHCPQNPYDLDLRAQIWAFDPQLQNWDRVFVAPKIRGQGGERVPRELGYRGMTVFQPVGESEHALYVTTWAPSKARGPVILQSLDGESFTPLPSPNLPGVQISAFRSLVPFHGRIYMAPTAQTGGRANIAGLPIILATEDPLRQEWRLANDPGFGDKENLTIFEMHVFNDFLYAGTLNAAHGFQVWKTSGEGGFPHKWTKVISDGAYRGPLNEAAVSFCVYGDALYIGTGIQNGGYDYTFQIGPAAAELIRVYADDTWDLVVGEKRATPQGLKRPLSRFGAGFDNFFNGYFWRMAEYDNCLYLGTFDWSIFLPYLSSIRPGAEGEKLVNWFGKDNLTSFEAGFDLFSSPDGIRWSPVTTNGFDNPYNYGARTLMATPHGFFVGAANPFGPQVALQTPSGWTYVANPRGGAEVWWGR